MEQSTYERAKMLQSLLKDIDELQEHLRRIDIRDSNIRLVAGNCRDGEYVVVSGAVKLCLSDAIKTALHELKKHYKKEFEQL
ncbi:MAG: hypothetical protein SPI72_03385 [Porphyromonas sp.]|nr:hypothetical protein [Porphyromonas sp.]